jgi:hypothetical protein
MIGSDDLYNRTDYQPGRPFPPSGYPVLAAARPESGAQAARYAEGAAQALNSLTDYRYLVLVSWEDMAVPADVEEHGVLYRHVNIPAAPLVPSRPHSHR